MKGYADEKINEFMDTHPDVCKQWPLKNRQAMRAFCKHEQIGAFFDAFLEWMKE